MFQVLEITYFLPPYSYRAPVGIIGIPSMMLGALGKLWRFDFPKTSNALSGEPAHCFLASFDLCCVLVPFGRITGDRFIFRYLCPDRVQWVNAFINFWNATNQFGQLKNRNLENVETNTG